MVNRASFTAGIPHAYAWVGLIIVGPDELRVIYAYSG